MEEHSALLELVRAVSVLDGVDTEPTEAGVRVARRSGPLLPWSQVADALSTHDPLDREPRLRLAVLVVLHRAVAELGPRAAAEAVRDAARPLALPVGHPLHPGPSWVQERVPGDVLDLGVGVVGLAGRDVLPLPPAVAALAGYDTAAEWSQVRALGTEWSDVALARLFGPADPPLVLTGAGGVDALTVLALPATRERLTGPVAAPARDKAWLGLGRRSHDESYLSAVWMLTAPARRGVLEPLSVSPDRVMPLRPAQRSGSSPIGS